MEQRCLKGLPSPRLLFMILQASAWRFPSVLHCKAAWEGAGSTVRWENSLGAGEQIPCLGKAAVTNVLLLRAHQCHLWVEKGLRESLCVSAIDLCFW